MAIVTALGIAGCGHEPRRIDPRGLPRDEYGLQELCPEKEDIRGPQATRLRHKRQRQLDALLAAFRRSPDARVRVTFTPEEGGKLGHEKLTVRELVQQNLDILRETDCDPQAQRRLQQALDDGSR